jgi:hypothetical protein
VVVWNEDAWLAADDTLLGTDACALMAVSATTVAANGDRNALFFTVVLLK